MEEPREPKEEDLEHFYNDIRTVYANPIPDNPSMNDMVNTLNYAFRNVASGSMSNKQAIKREFNNSEATEDLIKRKTRAERCRKLGGSS